MSSKSLSPLCSNSKVDGCVDFDNNSKTVTKRTTVARRSVNMVHKTYNTINKWGGYN